MRPARLRAGERRMLQTLAQRYPMKLTRAQLGTLASLIDQEVEVLPLLLRVLSEFRF